MRYQVTLDKPVTCGVLDVQASRDDLSRWSGTAGLMQPTDPNTFRTTADFTLYWIGREHWLVRTALEMEESLLALVSNPEMPESMSVVQVSDSLAFFAIQGPDAEQLISIASPLDVHQSVFPATGASYTEVFGLKALVSRCGEDFEVVVDRSYSDLLEDYFQRAVGDFSAFKA